MIIHKFDCHNVVITVFYIRLLLSVEISSLLLYDCNISPMTIRIRNCCSDHILLTESEGPTPVHAVVLYKGRFFSMDMVDENEEPLRAPEIQHQLTRIKDQCDTEPQGPGLGALTGETRKKWAEVC